MGLSRPAAAGSISNSHFPLVFGDSLRGIRLLAAVAWSPLVVQIAAVAGELGGRRFALLLSAICAVVPPQYLSNGSPLGLNLLEPNLWMGCAYFAMPATQSSEPRCWLYFGVCAGIGREETYTIGQGRQS